MLFNYIVQKGDSVYKIAMKYGVAPCLIMKINNLPPDGKINVGQVLLIPVGAMWADMAETICKQGGMPSVISKMTPEMEQSLSEPMTNCYSQQSTVPTIAPIQIAPKEENVQQKMEDEFDMKGQYERYTVKTGDTLFGLAKRYGTTIGNILSLNPQITNANELKVGMILTIPIPPEGSIVYIVRPGDSVFRISQRFGTTVEKMAEYNYLNDNYMIYPGQQLLVVGAA